MENKESCTYVVNVTSWGNATVEIDPPVESSRDETFDVPSALVEYSRLNRELSRYFMTHTIQGFDRFDSQAMREVLNGHLEWLEYIQDRIKHPM